MTHTDPIIPKPALGLSEETDCILTVDRITAMTRESREKCVTEELDYPGAARFLGSPGHFTPLTPAETEWVKNKLALK